MTGSLRPLTRSDLPALHALLTACGNADHDSHIDTLTDLETAFDDPWSDPADDAVVLESDDGGLSAYGRVFVNPETAVELTGFIVYAVHPTLRGQGLEETVLDWVEARGRRRMLAKTGTPEQERHLRIGRRDTLTTEIDRLTRRGFRPVRAYNQMRRDLAQPIPLIEPPTGVAVQSFSKDLEVALWTAHCEAFGDHWGYQTESLEDFRQFMIGSADFRPDLTVLAVVDQDVVAYAINRVHTEDNARLGVAEGKLELIGTRRAWRGRGLAQALITESMRRFEAAGLTHAGLVVDAENLTGALGLYERIGFEVIRRTVAFDLIVPAA